MAGKVSFRLTPETRKLLPVHEEFYATVLGLFEKGQSPLVLKARDPEARTETEVKANGDVEVTLVLPFDNNEQAGDGRIYLKDRFLFDPTQKVLKEYQRSFELGGSDSAAWKGWLAKYQSLLKDRPKLNDPRVLSFGLEVARTHAMPLVDEQEQTLKKFSEAFGREHRYLDSAHSLIKAMGQRQGVDGLKFRIKEKENHYQLLRQAGGKVELIINFAVDDDGSGDNGRIWLKDRFLLKNGKLEAFAREWSLDPRPASDPNFQVILEYLKNQSGPDMTEVRAFAENLYPELVSQEQPKAEDLNPLLAASLKNPPGDSVFKERRRDGATLQTQGEILELLQVLAGEDIAKRADAAKGLLSFGGGVDVEAEQAHLVSLFEAEKSASADGKNKPSSLLDGLTLSAGPAALREKLQRLTLFEELSSLAREHDSELRHEGLMLLAGKLFDRGYVGTALNIAERLSEIPKYKRRADKLLGLVRGRADFGSKVEFTVRNFGKELTKPSMLIGMMAAPFGGVAFEAAGLRGLRWLYDIGRIQRIGGGGKLVASVGGMFGESLAFTGIHRTYERLWHGSETAWHGAGNEVWSSMLLFGAMRATHAGGTWTGSRMAEGKLNFKLGSREIRFGGRLGAEPHTPNLAVTTPTGRLLLSDPWVPEAGVGRPALSPLGLASSGLLNHAGGIAAMQLAGWGSRMLDLAPISGQGFFNDSFDSMVAYFQAMMGFKLANKATLGRLQPALGEAKLRIGSLAEAGLPEPRNPAARHGLYRPNIPELRLFDLNQGGVRYDFRILPGREISLDMLLFGDEGRRIMVGMDPNGTYLIDRRPQVTNWGYHVPANHCRIFNLAEQALLFNRQIMANQTRVPIQSGDNLWLGMRNLYFTQPQSSQLFRILTELNPRQQMQLGARIDAVNDVEGLIRAFQAEGLDLSPAADFVKKVWQGKELLYGLPVELGLQSKVESLIQGDLRRGEREGLDETAVKMKPAAFNVRWSPVEKSFHVNRVIEQLHSRLKRASSIIEMANILRESPILEIEGKSISDIALSMNETVSRQGGSVQELPYTAGIRQRVRDILERDNYWASLRQNGSELPLRPRDPTMQPEYLELHQKFHELYRRIRQSEELRNELPQRQRNQLEELVYQVLERGQPVEILPGAGGLRGMVQMYQYEVVRIAERLFPMKMEARIDPWTGERIDPNNREARYRLAFHVLNFGANRPVLGVPSPHERVELTRLVRKYLNENQPGNFLDAQVTLRDHFDRATPEAQNMLRSIRPEEKATVLGLYFGPFRRRDLAPSTAFQVSTWMGQAGMFREVGVTYEIRHESLRATLSLGNLGNVEPQHRDDFFSLHTHPETYVGPGGRRMGYESAGHVNTIILGNASISRSTLNILPSQVDLRLYHTKSQDYWRMGNPMRFGETPLFKPEGNRFRNWVIHSLGISKVDVVLNDQGQPQRIEVQFAARRLARLLNSEYQRQKQTLEAMSTEFNLPVVVSEADYAGLMAEMPYGVHSLFENR